MFFIIRPPVHSVHQQSASDQAKLSLTSHKAQPRPSIGSVDAEGALSPLRKPRPFGDDGTKNTLARRHSIEHSKEPSFRARSNNDNDMLIEIGKCIKNLKVEKNVLKAENAQLTQDIRRMNALRAQKRVLDAEMKKLVGNIHERREQIQGQHRLALKKARAMRKLATQTEEVKWAELKVTEGMLDPYVQVDEGENVVLRDEYREYVEKEILFDAYTEAKSSFDSLNAAMSRLQQSKTELLDLGEFVSKVENIAIGDMDVSSDRFDPFPAIRCLLSIT